MEEGEPKLPTRSRSLRVRRSIVDYSEDEGEDYPEPPLTEKKRGSKRKAEVNIESLYCQENVKEVCPTSLETIFESPKQGGGGVKGRPKKNACQTAVSEQLMSVKKMKRFCSFTDFYNPTKQKTRVRKDRARKFRQLTGVKLPKGKISDEALQTVLGGVSDEDDQNKDSHSNTLSKLTSSFYCGNVIRPDIEDISINEVIDNISSMKMITESNNQPETLSKTIPDNFDVPLLFVNGEELNRPQPKRARRRSEKFSRNLHPNLLGRDLEQSQSNITSNDKDGDVIVVKTNIDMDERQMKNIDKINEEVFTEEPDTNFTHASKRPNGLSDKKVIKKTKLNVQIQKRQNESIGEQCLKKRGELGDIVESTLIEEQTNDMGNQNKFVRTSNTCLEVDVEHQSAQPDRLLDNKLGSSHKKASPTSFEVNRSTSIAGRGRKRGKRRVSGVERPLYRKILAPPSPEVTSENEGKSPKCVSSNDASPVCSITSNVPLREVNVKCSPSSTLLSLGTACSSPQNNVNTKPPSPCTQMAALSLKSERERQASHESGIQLRRTRRRSQQFVAPQMATSFESKSLAPVLDVTNVQSGSEKEGNLSKDNSERIDNCQEAQKGNLMCEGALESKQSIPNDHLKSTDADSNFKSSEVLETLSEKPICIDNVNSDNAHPSQSDRNNVFDFKLLEESEGIDSPIITGIIENRAKIRCGKMYRNSKAMGSSV